MSDVFPSLPVTITGAPRPTAAELDHQRWMDRPEQPQTMLKVISAVPPPTESELESDRLRRLRPAGTMAADYRAALAEIEAEKPVAAARLAGCQEQAAAALMVGTTADIRSARVKVEDAAAEVERLTLLAAEMRRRLARAEAVEAATLQDLADRVPAAEQVVAKFRRAMAVDYAKAAAAIVAVVAQEAEAEKALATLQEAAARLPDHQAPESLPRGPRGRAMRLSVALPGYLDRPPEAPPVPAVRY